MASGNPLLKGWSLSLDSFWAVDALFYAAIEAAIGVHSLLLYLVPAIIAALVVALGAVLARDRRKGPAAWAAALTVVALLGMPTHSLSTVFLRGPLHVGTVLWCLIAFAGLRSGRLGWGWIVAVVFLTAGLLGDGLTFPLGVAPVIGGGAVAMLRTRTWRAGAPEVAAAVAAVVLDAGIRQVADLAGSFTINTHHPIASAAQAAANLPRIATWSAGLLGVGDNGLGNGGVPAALQIVHVAGLAVVVLAVALAAAALFRGAIRGRAPEPQDSWRLDDLLILAVISDLVVFVVLTYGSSPGYLRYLTGALVFGSVLAGRAVGGAVDRSLRPSWVSAASGVTVMAVSALLAAGFGFTLAAPLPNRPFSHLGRYLETRHLTEGVGDYWSASIVTVATDGAVTVRPVVATPKGRVERYQRQSSATWYEGSFQFLVYNTAEPWGGVDLISASATFGRVSSVHDVGTYRVLTWRHRIRVSTVGYDNDG